MIETKRWNDFLQNITVRLGIDKQPKNFFVARFIQKNLDITDDEFIEWLKSDEAQKNHPSIYSRDKGNYAKQMTTVYAKAEKECPELKDPKNVNDKKNILGAWLKNQYIQWVEQQKKEYGSIAIHQQPSHNWHEVCSGKLEHWKKRNVDLVIGDNRLDFDNIDRTFVPLDFLEKVKKESSQSKNADPRSKQQTEEYKSTQRYERQQDFLDVIIRSGLSERISKKQGQRLAIIGEAGSGKTTLLLQIGYELLKQPKNLVIWISLKEVRDKQKTIWDYILEEWLKGSDIEKNEWKQEFDNKLKDGCVWLLLDGLEDISDRAYSTIGKLDDWLSKPKIALTCRKNRWDSDKADFASFDYAIYECLGYNSDQPSNFIDAWFGDDSESANRLKSELQQANRQRINDLIKYPLHLSLLCSIYEKSESNFAFATNKAELFDQFIKRQYKRKITKDRFDADLVKSLGKLAIKAIDTQSQLTNAEVKEKLGDKLDKALELGWLKPIDEYEQVYDFLHDSFKEYFAALAIDDWDFFLPRDHANKPVQGKRYRVFELNWNEVVLLWSGISQNSNTKNKSTLFIEKLLAFEDGCAVSNDYNYFGRLIALDIALESNNINLFDSILDEIIEWAFGCLDQNTHKWTTYINEEEARLKLKNVSREILINRISKLLPDISSENSILDVINFLLSINTTCSITIAIEYLLKLAIEPNFRKKSTGTIWYIQHHSRIIAGNSYLIKLFVGFIFSLDPDFRYIVFGFIQDPTLSKLMYSQDSNESVYLLEKIFVSDPEKLIAILDRFNFMEFYFESLKINLEPIKNSPKSINREYLRERWDSLNTSIAFEDSFPLDDYEYEPEEIVCCEVSGLIADLVSWMTLPEEPDHEEYMNASSNVTRLIDLLKMSFEFEMYGQYLEIDYENLNFIELHKIAVRNLYQSINSNNDRLEGLTFCYKALFFCAQNMSYPDFYDAWHCQATFIHPEIVDIIPSNNTNAIQILESQLIDCEAIQKELDRTSEHPEIRCLVINIRHLEKLTDQNLLTKRIWNGLQKQFPDSKLPKVNDIGDLEYGLDKLQRELGKKLAIALYGKSANEAIAQLCQSLTESIPIHPFTGEKSTQELIAKINAWLSEL